MCASYQHPRDNTWLYHIMHGYTYIYTLKVTLTSPGVVIHVDLFIHAWHIVFLLYSMAPSHSALTCYFFACVS